MSKCIMKLVLLSLAVISFQARTVVAFDALSDPSLIAWWGFDEGAGTLAGDGSGNGNHGTVNGGAAWVPGVHGEALAFNGSDAYVSTEKSLLNGLTAFTLAGWISAGNTGSYASLFGQNDLIELGLTSENGGGVGTWMAGNGWAYIGAEYPFAYPSWHHVAMTGDAARVVIYIDGQEQASDEGGMTSGTSSFLFSIGANVFNTTGDPLRGEIDDVWVYSRALTQAEIKSLMKGAVGPEQASSPSPENEATDVPRDSVLSWTPGEFAVKHHVYFGPEFEGVNGATVPTSSQDANSFDPGRMEFDTTYYWRVDEVNGAPDNTVFRGGVLSFTTEPYSVMIPIDVTKATASSSAKLSPPSMTVNGSGLTGNSHSVRAEQMWLSGSPDLSPWLMWEFNSAEKLDKMLIWNSNSGSELFVGWGVKDMNIEYSIDGEAWTALAGPTRLEQAPGLPEYDTPQVIDLGLVHARYVRLNILSNWGGLLKQYGVAEVQFFGLPVHAREPVPASGSTDVLPNLAAAWRAGREAGQHTLYMSDDPNAVAQGLAPSLSSGTNRVDLSPLDLHLGETYYWRVDEVNEAETPSVWEGPVWNLSTPSALIVDDFERYGNLSPNRPFQTWLDGFGYSADEYLPVAYGGNGTESGVGHDIWNPGSSHFGGQIMERAITRSGSQSLPFYYTGGTASQIDRKWSAPQDWSGNGIQTLVLYFYGAAGNTGQLYAKINNTRINYDGDASNLTRLRWNPWYIDLSAQSVSSVTTLSIGVDGANADGMLLMDDIGLYKSAPEPVTPVAPSTDGLVAHWKLDDGAGTKVADSAGSNTGTIIANGLWTTGHLGGALQLDGLNAYVDCGAGTALNITDVVTLSVWVKPMDAGNGEHNPYIAKGDHTYAIKHATNNSFEFFVQNGGVWHTVNVPVTDAFNDNWHHLAGTFDGFHAKIYVNGVLSGTTDYEGPIASTTHAVNLGRNSENTDRLYEGVIDDARIYHRVLSEAEILYLSNH